MNTLLRKILNLRPGEEIRAALMFAYSFLLIASITIVKPVRTSLLIEQHGPQSLPYVFIMTALATPLFVVLYNKLAKRMRLSRLIAATCIVSIFLFLVVWTLLTLGYQEKWFIYSFYVWVTIFGLIATTQFWLLANYVFNSREAKRLFSVVGAGAIAGGILGGYLTSVLAIAIGTAGMLHLCCISLAVCLLLQFRIWKGSAKATYDERLRRYERQRTLRDDSSPWSLLLQSRLSIYIGAIVGVGVIVGTLVDYQFSVIAAASISDADELTAFFGLWLSSLSVISFLLQMLVTSRALHSIGVNMTLMVLPFIVIIGSGVVILLPSLFSATGMKVAEGGLKQSMHKSGLELIGLPVPAHLKNRVKALVDVAVDSMATGVAGIIVLALMFVGYTQARELSIVILTLALVWLYLIYRAKPEYLNAFRIAIERRAIRPEDISYEMYSSMRADHLIELLSSKNDRQVLTALGYLENMGDRRLAEYLVPLAASTSKEVIGKVYRIAKEHTSVDLTQHAQRHQNDLDPDIRISATRYLLHRSNNKQVLADSFLASSDIQIRSAAIVAAAKEWATDESFRTKVDLQHVFREVCAGIESNTCSRDIGLAMATALSIAPQVSMHACIDVLLKSSDHEVASHAALSAGRTQDAKYVELLISRLSDRTQRVKAREALSEFGDSIIDRLTSVLHDQTASFRIRLEIPRVLSMIGTQLSFVQLADNLGTENVRLRYEVIRALNRMRIRDTRLRVRSRKIDPIIRMEMQNYYKLVQVLNCIEAATSETDAARSVVQATTARRLLARALNEKLLDNRERLFRLLGLKYEPKDMFNAYLGISSSSLELRSNAIELIELVLSSSMKSAFVPIAECVSRESLIAIGSLQFGIHITSETEALNILLDGDDDWLRTAALHVRWYIVAGPQDRDCREFETHENATVRETAMRIRQEEVFQNTINRVQLC